MKHGLHYLTMSGILLLLGSSPLVAENANRFEPDFFFDFSACRTVAAPLGPPSKKDDGFIMDKPSIHRTACMRVGKKELECVTLFEGKSAKPAVYKMRITTELTQMIIIESENGGDFLVAKPAEGRVVSTTRIVGESFLATKMCHGVYLTGDELKAMLSKKKGAD
jgi:hypothetical protein